MVGDGERITIAFVTELELALVAGAPQIVRLQTIGERCAFGSRARPAHSLHQAMAIQHRMYGTGGGHFDGVRQTSQQTLTDLRAPQCGFSRLAATMAASTGSGSWFA